MAGAGLAAVGLLVLATMDNGEPLGPDTDRHSATIDAAIGPYRTGRIATAEDGAKLAKELNLRGIMDDIVANNPDAEFVSTNPPIIEIKNFMTDDECDNIIRAGKPGLQPSTGTGALKDGRFERTNIPGRTSYNAWCMGQVSRLDCREVRASPT